MSVAMTARCGPASTVGRARAQRSHVVEVQPGRAARRGVELAPGAALSERQLTGDSSRRCASPPDAWSRAGRAADSRADLLQVPRARASRGCVKALQRLATVTRARRDTSCRRASPEHFFLKPCPAGPRRARTHWRGTPSRGTVPRLRHPSPPPPATLTRTCGVTPSRARAARSRTGRAARKALMY